MSGGFFTATTNTMAEPSITELISLFDSLKKSINAFYAKYSDLDADGTIDMRAMMRDSDKVQLYIDGDLYALWQMEREDAERLSKTLQVERKDREWAQKELAAALSGLQTVDARLNKADTETKRIQEMVDAYLGDKEDGEITEDEEMPPLISYEEFHAEPSLKVALPPETWPTIPSSPDARKEEPIHIPVLSPSPIKHTVEQLIQEAQDRLKIPAPPRERVGFSWPTSPITENFVDDGGLARSGHFVL
jgi:hypothetical protein